MSASARSKAEQKFANLTRKDTEARKERERAYQAGQEKTSRLRALRLAKEAADKQAADKQAAEKEAADKERASAKAPKPAKRTRTKPTA